jgi:redox-sensitive bicupin YhaK (pirin superfamily)
MSFSPQPDPELGDAQSCDAIDMMIVPRSVDLGGFDVRRVLPHADRRMVGPFVFFDHFGPAEFKSGDGLDVRPHPHIGLATVTYLYDGEIMHRDSLGSALPIRPGDVNWMTAGRGIVHSERTPAAQRAAGPSVHGLQLWLALPTAHEEIAPAFHHHPADTIPALELPGARLRVIAGSAYGTTSPVHVLSPLFYVEAHLDPGAIFTLPAEYAERAAYVVEGTIAADAQHYGTGTMVVFRPDAAAEIRAPDPAHVVLLGGAALEGERHMWWNFVSSSLQRIEQAKDDWKNRRFPSVPGDEVEYIPLPNK